MSSGFRFEIKGWIENESASREVAATTAEVSIQVNGNCATEVEDRRARTVRDTVRISAYMLAIWLSSNWWRLRWEPQRGESGLAHGASLDWKMSHMLAASGSGYVWPPLTFASDGQRVSIYCDSVAAFQPSDLSPIRYLNSFQDSVAADQFEQAAQAFVEAVLARLDSLNIRETPLHDVWRLLIADQRKSATRLKRKLEALLGIDPDEDESLVTNIQGWRSKVGADALDEIAAGTPSATLEESLRNASEAAGRARHVAHIADVGVIRANVKDFGGEEAKIPWRAGREVAYRLRKFWDLGFAPVPSAKLAERLSIRTDYLLAARSNLPWAFGFAANDNRKLSFVLNRKYQPSARFDIARIIGDHLYFDTNDRWKPTTTSWTARQKFQRAFAAEFLCPSKAVEDRYRASPFPLNSLDENIDALSREYEVSPQVVRYHLLNRKLIGRNLAPDGYESESLISSV